MAVESVKEFYAGRSVFVTGATGFIGKVLIEKLLRSCPKIDKIYMLIRMKKGKTPEERVRDIASLPLFDKLNEQFPNTVEKKLKPLLGDVTALGLGLSDEDKKLLIENVSIIFHVAASVRFDDPLKTAVLMNTRATRETINLAMQMKKLDVFLQVSTTYCNIDRHVTGEQLYPAHADWKKTIEIVENTDDHVLQILTNKYMDGMPNTYTFTKSLAEHVVYDMCKGKIPAIVFRPSIVISSRNDPVPGWIDNFNGPVGLLVASGKGILRSCYTTPDLKADYMPVDLAVRALIIAAWHKGTTNDLEEKLDVSFYNASNNGMHSLTMSQLIDFGRQIFWEAPLSNILWYPGGSVTGCKYWNYIRVILFHLLPALIIDGMLKLADKKPMLVKIQRRIFIANMALQYFITNHWSFLNDKCLALENKLAPDEKDEFGYGVDDINVYEYFRNCVLHGRRYLMKEDDSNIERAKVNLYRMYVLDTLVSISCYAFTYWFLVYKLNILAVISQKLYSIYEGLLG